MIDGIVGYDVFEEYLIDMRFDLGNLRFVKKLSYVQLNNYAKLNYDNNYRKPIVSIKFNLHTPKILWLNVDSIWQWRWIGPA